MEKKVNRYASLIRIICYILIPICAIGIVQSMISLLYFANQTQSRQINNYYETDEFIDLYRNSIYNNVQACYFENENNEYDVSISNLHGVEILQEQQHKNIYYRTYLERKNFKFLIIDNKTNTAFTNLELTTKTDSIEKIKNEITGYDYYWNYTDNQINTNISSLSLDDLKYNSKYKEIENEYDCTIYTGIETPLKNYDDYYEYYLLYEIAANAKDTAIINLPLCLSIIFLSIVLITVFAGKMKGEKEIYLNLIDKIPLEIMILFGFIMLGFSFAMISEISNNINVIGFVYIFVLLLFLYILGIISYETFVKRIKTHTLLKNTIIYKAVKFLVKTTKNIFDNLNLAIKIGIILVTFGIINIILVNCDFLGVFILLVIYAFIFKTTFEYVCKVIEIKETAKKIYEGNADIRLKEENYNGVLKELCIYINDIASGLTNAVEEALKSERMKTELITNVSHDIKTPLTSIINYVDLLKKEEMPNEKAKEYLEILDQKSQRLKRLTDDLVEASKASSGNIKLNLEKIDVKELIKQVSGEFEDKLKDKKLDLILSMPEEETTIKADSRYLYRVVENMYSNIVKYALPDSRVYVDIILEKEIVKIELKNISKNKLNISVDELMERFVREESSRNTEGSGLGLSIAQSLTELQNGKFNIYLDGDLFKVTITFEKN